MDSSLAVLWRDPAVQTFTRAQRAFSLSTNAAAALERLSHTENASPFVVACAAFGVVLHRFGFELYEGDPSFREVVSRARDVVRAPRFEIALADGAVEYNADRFDAATVDRLIAHVETVAAHLDPEARISELPLLAPAERQQVLVEWNRTMRPVPDCRIEDLIEQQVARTPDEIAVRYEDAQLTYRELDARANQIAHHLRALGVDRDVLVPIIVERSLELLPALLGILKADGAYVPIDPGYPTERIAFMLEDSAPRVIVTQARFADRIPAGPWQVVTLESIADGPTDKPRPRGTASNLAYGIYTSGSTGKPKCALIEHRSAVNLLLWMQETYPLDATDRVLQKTPITFDVSVSELFWPLFCGARLVVARPDGHRDVTYLFDVIQREQITTLSFVPSLLEIFVNEPALADCTSLRRVLAAGEALAVDVQARFFAKSHAELHNIYGPTETTVYSASWVCRRDSTERTIPIGRPIANTQMYVLDARNEPVPIGAPGELYIGGVGLARGYLNRPELTTARFVPDPFTGARLYRTGDVARFRPDGTIEYLGRTDHQVKLRGFRIELGEIEARLREHPAIRDAVAIVRDKRLVAYVVARHAVVREELAAHLRARLPEYMVPSDFVVLDALPLNPSGKVDRAALPAPEIARTRPLVAPRTATEQLVATIWREVLGVDEIGVHDDFFELGGHSLLAMQAASRIRVATNVALVMSAFFDAPTIDAVARTIDAGAHAPSDAIPRIPRGEPLPLSSAQDQLWFLHALDPGSVAYNIPLALRLRGPLDVAALARSLDELVRRHEALRTTIAGGRMMVTPHMSLALAVEHVASEAEAEALMNAEVRRTFDLERGPLVRARLLGLGERDHILVVTLHHIIADGWSCDVLQQELVDAYASRHLPEPALQLADYAAWERTRDLANALTYWRQHVSGAPFVLELPADRPRPSVQGVAGATQRFVMPAQTVEAIARLCRAEGVTPFMVLFAAFSVLLHRYSGQDKLLVGVPVANRDRTETERLVGMLVNTLAFAADLSGEPTFREVLQRTRIAALGGFAHQHLPFNKLVEAVQPARDPSRSPLVQAMFAYQTTAVQAADRAGDVEVTRVPLSTGTSKFELMLELTPQGTELAGAVEYNTDLFESATIARLVEHFGTLVTALVADPSARVAEVPLLTPRERHQLLVEWNATARPFPDRRLEQLFEEQAARTPDAIAVRFEDAQLTYRELDARANQIAHRLLAQGVGPDVLVPLYVDRSLEMLPAILGILKADGAYVPLDPAYPPDRVAFMLADCAPRVIVAQRRFAERLPAGPWEVLCVDEPLDGPRTTPPRRGTAGQLAYGIYTSGSTGTPKCALVEHRGAVSLLHEETYHLDASDRVLQKTPLTFDASVPELFGPLRVGACLIVARPDGHKDVRYLVDVVQREQITSITFVPSLLDIFANEPALAQCTSLRRILVGGEALTYDVQTRLFARTHAELHNTYGPTETTVTSTFWPCVRDGDRTVPIGRPVGNTTVYVLDAHMQPVPIGVHGELYIGGVALARGYLNRPELTSERFVENPFTPGARLYRTGDVVRYRADGNLEYLGRTDHQVKIRGFRVELGEIEACLRTHPQVRDVIVVARDKHLVAYVIADADPEALRAHVRGKLPDYMVPAAFVMLDAFPLMVNGKVDRKALPAPSWTARGERVAPETPTEARVAELWRELLHADAVGVCDDFFELGGHSLLAMQVLARIREALGADVSVRAFFDGPTVRALARCVDAAQHARADAIPRVTDPVRLSSTQEQLWFLRELDPTSVAYHTPLVLRLRGALDEEALSRSVDALVNRHDVLRSTIARIGDVPHMQIAPHTPHVLRAEPVASLAEAEARATAEVRTTFDLERGPLFRTRLLRIAADDHVLVFTMHHIISDGWSCTVLERELLAAYAAFVAGVPWTPAPLPIRFADYASWERTRDLAGALAYWKAHVDEVPPVLDLPTDRPRPSVQTFAGARRRFVLDGEAIATLCRAEGVTPFMTLFGVFAVLLHRYTGQARLLVGVPVANRSRTETEGVVGLFLNTLAFAADLSGDPTFREVLSRVRATTLGGFAHQELPFNRLVEELQPSRDLSRSPLVQVMFAYQVAEPHHGPLAMARMPLDTRASQFEMTLDVEARGTELACTIEYNTDLFDDATIARFVQQFEQLTTALVADPAQRIAAAPLVTPAERHQLAAWNTTARAIPERRIEQLFEQQAARTPNAVAVRFEGAQLTYAELDARANQVAHRLRALGVGPDVLVPIHVERSLEMLAGVLGILKADGAYVPLDPEWPTDRLAFMLDDVAPSVILTHSRFADRLPAGSWQTVCLDTLTDGPIDPPERRGTNRNLAYGIYTSGSTGTPKCALVEHRSVVNLFGEETCNLRPDDRVLQKVPLTFDPSVQELFAPLAAGGVVVVARPDGHRDMRYLLETIRAERITVLVGFVPSLLELVVAEPGFAECTSLRLVQVGGEALSPDLVARFFAKSGAELHNAYGPTETTIYSSFWKARRDATTVPIGSAIGNTQLHVLDALLQPVPIGVAGELCVGGAGLARGYLNRPELTRERFVTVDGARLYRTGDTVRYRADGMLEFLGRTDHQVKVRGFRIELGEIESCLRAHPMIRDAVVVVREDVPGQKQLVAYAVTPTSIAVDELRTLLRSKLPEHMVPAMFVFLDAFPLLTSGKVDRKALPAPERQRAANLVAPRTATEEIIAGIWREVLRIEHVGVTEDFFELGGHSLLAMQIAARLRRALNLEIPLRKLLQARTIEAQAKLRPVEDLGAFIVRSDDTVARATIAQEQFWYLSQDDSDPTAYFVSSAFVLDGPLDRALFERSYCELVAYHSIFRTAFLEIDGLLHQLILPEPATPPAIELEERFGAPQDEAVEHAVAELMTRPCDLARGRGVIRARLVALAPERHVFVLLVHHIASDGAVFTEQLFDGYTRLRAGSASALPDERPLQYIDFAHARARWCATPTGQAQRAYWDERVRGAAPLALTGDFPRAPIDARRDAQPFGITAELNHPPAYMPLPADVRATVIRAARAEKTTPFMVYFGALAWLFHELTGQDDVSIQTTANNRPEYPVLEQVQGPFAWWTHVRIDLSGKPTFREAIARTQRAVEGAREHGVVEDYFQRVPHPLRRSAFNYLPLGALPELRAPDLQIGRVRRPFPKWKRHWDLHLTLQDFADSTVLVWTGIEALYRRETVMALLQRYIDILARAAD